MVVYGFKTHNYPIWISLKISVKYSKIKKKKKKMIIIIGPKHKRDSDSNKLAKLLPGYKSYGRID